MVSRLGAGDQQGVGVAVGMQCLEGADGRARREAGISNFCNFG